MSDRTKQRGVARRSSAALGMLVLAAACVLLGGCATGASSLDSSGVDDLLLHMNVTDIDSMDATYEVGRAHEIAFAGGRSAIQDETAWRGELTDAEFAELTTLLEKANWFRAGQAMVDAPGSRRYDIVVNAPGGKVNAKLKGDCQPAEAVYELLDQAARRRFDEMLDKMPKPSNRSPVQPSGGSN